MVFSLVDGVRIVVPDSIDLLTPYVLREQGDWFEDEIRFVRRALEPGQQAVDIGANYGVYALSIGKAVGPAGRVWAFEPASKTADFLAASIAENGYSHVVLERSALSSATGHALLSLNFNPELNALKQGGLAAGRSERVPLATLDERSASLGWKDLDFVKIDAEGEELNILRGGASLFSEMSPLVQYEIQGGNVSCQELVAAFAERGYRSYRLVPGLGLLAPFDPAAPVDEYALNLFCCKPDRAARLAARGLLVEAVPAPGSLAVAVEGSYGWQSTLVNLPYGQVLAGLWQRHATTGIGADVAAPLALYALSRDPSRPPAERLAALETAYSRLQALCAVDSSRLRLVSLARVARDLGSRQVAVQSLIEVLNRADKARGVDVGEPFLAPGPRFDVLPPGPHISNWVVASLLEELERLAAHSSYFIGDGSLERLAGISELGFGSDEMRRRKELVEKRFSRGDRR